MDDILRNEDEILDAMQHLSDISEDLDDVDADPNFFISSDEESGERRRTKLPVFLKVDPSVDPISTDEDDDTLYQSRNEYFSPKPSTSGEKFKSTTINIKAKKETRNKSCKKTTSKQSKSAKNTNKKTIPKKKPKIPWVNACILKKKIPFDKCHEKLPENIMNLDTPYAFFKYFFDENLLQKIVRESQLYLVQQDPNTNKSVTALEIQKYLGICIMMSIVRLPNVRCYWKESIGNSTIRETMGVNKFEFIRSILHFNDNFAAIPRGDPGHDRLHKLRPVVEALRSKFKSISLEEMLCVDEQMCATKAKNYLRQYLPKKPHKWGYKIYVLSGVSGFAYDIEIYTGQENDEALRPMGEPDLGSCANVVVRLSRCIPPNNHKLYFDNFYTSLPLLVHLANRNIHALGTVRRDRVPDNSLPPLSELKVKERGFCAENCTNVDGVEISCVVWKDNQCVTLLSSFVGTGKQCKVKRYNKKKREVEDVSCPDIVKVYNEHMGGVDKINSIIGRYKIRMKTKKWYMRLFYHLLDVTICNSWLLYIRVHRERGETEPMALAEFRESVALTMCKLGSNNTPKRGRPSTELDVALASKAKKPHVSALPPKEVRRDETGHWPIWNDSRLRCKMPNCKSRSFVSCVKCKITLCLNKDNNCFLKFHTM